MVIVKLERKDEDFNNRQLKWADRRLESLRRDYELRIATTFLPLREHSPSKLSAACAHVAASCRGAFAYDVSR